ncbi:MAG: hypothetical protein AAFX06_16660 [Planctomycetota bacterium]
MVESIIASVVSAAITGLAGWYLKGLLTREEYLPSYHTETAKFDYKNFGGDWFLYHFTGDSKISKKPVFVSSKLKLQIRSGLIVEGTEHVQVDHRKRLEYRIRGEIRAGQFHFSAICVHDPSEVYTGMFPNLLDDEATGAIVARDYDRVLFTSPALMSKSELTFEQVAERFRSAKVKLHSPPPVKRVTQSTKAS